MLLGMNSDLANLVADIASAVSAVLATLVSWVALYVSHVTLKHQQQHNILSVRPLPMIAVADFDDSIRVKLTNNGSGPLIVRTIAVRSGTETRPAVVAWMSKLPAGLVWTDFAGPISDRSLLPEREVVLIRLDGSSNDDTFVTARDCVRKALASLTVEVVYTDVYESSFVPYRKSLTWFGRHWVDSA